MSHREQCGPTVPCGVEKFIQDHPLVARIEIPGGFIRQHQARPRHQGSADRSPLSLTLAESIHRTSGQPVDSQAAQEFLRMVSGVAVEWPRAKSERQQDVPEDVEMIEQSKILEDDADPLEPETSTSLPPHQVEP